MNYDKINELIGKLCEGDKEAESQLYEIYIDRIRLMANRYALSLRIKDPDDVSQEAWIKIVEWLKKPDDRYRKVISNKLILNKIRSVFYSQYYKEKREPVFENKKLDNPHSDADIKDGENYNPIGNKDVFRKFYTNLHSFKNNDDINAKQRIELLYLLRNFFNDIDEVDRYMLEKRYYFRWGFKEIGEDCNITAQAVHKRWIKIHKKLKRYFNRNDIRSEGDLI